MNRRPLTVRVARWSAEHPWRAIALWVVFVAVCFVGGNSAGLSEAKDHDPGEAGRSEAIVDSGHFDDPAKENVLITARSGALEQSAARATADDAAKRLRALPGVASVDDAVPARDGSALLVPFTLAGDPDTADARVQPLLDTTAAVQRDHPALRVEEVGSASIDKALNDTLGKDFKRAELLSLPVTLAILIVAFGALIAAGVPVLLALSSVMAAMGLSTLASHLVPGTDTTSSVVLLIGMAVGVDYSLFYIRREREERAKGKSHLDAVEIAAETSGHAVVVSGTAVIIAMAGLFLAGDAVFSSLAVGSIMVVLVTVIGSLTVLPALLAKLGRWVDRPRVPLLWRLTDSRRTSFREGAPASSNSRAAGPRFWPAILRPALRYPVATLLISTALLLTLAVPALGMKMKFPGAEDLPRTTTAMQAYDRMTAAFPSTGTSHTVAVRAPAAQQAEVKAALIQLANNAHADPLFAPADGAEPEIAVSADGRVSTLEVATPYASRSEQAKQSLDRLRRDLVPATLGKIANKTTVEYAVGGGVAASEDYAAHIRQKLPIVMGFVLVLTFLVMTLTFRSVVIALTSILLNLLSVAASYGLLVVVFQGTWAEQLLGFTSMGAIVSWLPLFLFVVLFGLSMDYHVFVVSRIREAVRRGMPDREAVAYGITSSAGVVSSAAIVMVGVFSIFATLSTIDMKQLGIGLGAAILLDATIIRAVVLPAAMTMLGKANWWAPKFLRPDNARRDNQPQDDQPQDDDQREMVSMG